MRLILDERAQVGGIAMYVLGILVLGFFYVAFGAIQDQNQIANNVLINSGMSYSQDHYDAMDILFKYWWAIPIYFIILFAIYAIKNGLTKDASEAYR